MLGINLRCIGIKFPNVCGNYCPQKFLFCPTEVLLDSRIQSNLLCRDRIPVILLVELAVGSSGLNVSVNSFHVELTISDVSTLIYLRILGEVELVELVPADKIPLTIPFVKHKLATTYTTYLPNEVA